MDPLRCSLLNSSAPAPSVVLPLGGALGELLARLEDSCRAALVAAATNVRSTISVVVEATGSDRELRGRYCLGDTFQEALAAAHGIVIPNVWTVGSAAVLRKALPKRAQFLDRRFLEQHAYPSTAAVSYYSNFGYWGWAEFPLPGGFHGGAKVTFMRSRSRAQERPFSHACGETLRPLRTLWKLRGLWHRAIWETIESSAVDSKPLVRLADHFLLQSQANLPRLAAPLLQALHAGLAAMPDGPKTAPRAVVVGRPLLAGGLMRMLEGWRCHQKDLEGDHSDGAGHRRADLTVVVIEGVADFTRCQRLQLFGRRGPLLVVLKRRAPALVLRSLAAGAAGIVTFDTPRDRFAEAAESVLAGRRWIDSGLEDCLDVGAEGRLLSSREAAVLAQAAEGRGDKQIAEALGLSVHTVDTHLRGCFRKLGARGRVEAIERARQAGEID